MDPAKLNQVLHCSGYFAIFFGIYFFMLACGVFHRKSEKNPEWLASWRKKSGKFLKFLSPFLVVWGLLETLGVFDDPEPDRASHMNAGTALEQQDHYDAALAEFEKAAAFAQQGHHPELVALSQVWMAETLEHKGEYQRALQLLGEAIPTYEKTFGRDGGVVGELHNNLGRALYALNRVPEAETNFRKAIAIAEKTKGPDSTDVADATSSLGELLHTTRRDTEAEPLFRHAVAIYENASVGNGEKLPMSLGNLAVFLEETNRSAEAEPLHRHALDLQERLSGPDHPQVALRLNNLATNLIANHHANEAEKLLRRALDIDEKKLGPDHPVVATTLSNLGLLLSNTSRPEEAEPLARRALAIDEKSFGPDHPNLATPLSNLALLLQKTNRLNEALPFSRRGLLILDKTELRTGQKHFRYPMMLSNYRVLLKASGWTKEKIDDEIETVAKEAAQSAPAADGAK